MADRVRCRLCGAELRPSRAAVLVIHLACQLLFIRRRDGWELTDGEYPDHMQAERIP